MNHITLMGHLGADPEVRFTSGGNKVTSLRVASNSKKSGKEETTWWKVTLWGEQFDKIVPHFKKGSAVIIYGELSPPEIFNGRDGNPQVSLNLVAHSIAFPPFSKRDREYDAHQSGQQNAHYSSGSSSFSSPNGQKDSMSYGSSDQSQEDEIPF